MSTATIDQLISQIYDGLLDQDGWASVVNALTHAVGGSSGLIYVANSPSGEADKLASFGAYSNSELVSKYLSSFEQLSPIDSIFRDKPEGFLSAVGEFAFSPSYQKSTFFKEWARPQGFGDLIGCHLVRQPGHYAWISFRRDLRRGIYPRIAVNRARRAAPHLSRALKVWARLGAQSNLEHTISGALDAINFGVLIVDLGGRILRSNSAAERILGMSDGILSIRGRIGCQSHSDATALLDAIRWAAQPSSFARSPNINIAVARGDRRPLMVYVVPPASRMRSAYDLSPRTAAALFIVDPELLSSRPIEVFCRLYGLTPAESHLLREVIGGEGLAHAASRLGIAVSTARTQLKQVFAKTRTSRQAELVRIFLDTTLSVRPDNFRYRRQT